jgi:hypothetical protein
MSGNPGGVGMPTMCMDKVAMQWNKGFEQHKGLFSHLASTVPLGRIGQPSEIGKAVTFLASDDATV